MDNYTDFKQTQWNELTTPVLKNEQQESDNISEESAGSVNYAKRSKASSPVLTIQLVLCLLTLTALFLLKTFYHDVFGEIKDRYDSEITAKMYFSGDFSNLDYSSIFSSTTDEI